MSSLPTYPGMGVPPHLSEEPRALGTAGQPITEWTILKDVALSHKGLLAWGMLAATIVEICTISGPWMLGVVTDKGIIARDVPALLWLSAIVLALDLIATFGAITRHRIMTKFRTATRAHLLRLLTRHISLTGGVFTRRVGSGELVNVASTDLDRIGMLYTSVFPGGISGLMVLIGVGVLSTISWEVALVFLAGLVVIVVASRYLGAKFVPLDAAFRQAQGDYTDQVTDVLSGLRILTGIGGKKRYAAAVVRRSRHVLERGIAAALVGALLEMVGRSGALVLVGFTVWVAAMQGSGGDLTAGQVVQSVSLALMLLWPLQFAMSAFIHFPAGLVSARRIEAVLRTAPDIPDEGTAAPPAHPVRLVDPSSGLEVDPGVYLGVATTSSAVADALAGRLTRFNVAVGDGDEHSAVATWGGRPLSDYPLPQVRSRIVLADSAGVLLSGTIREALTLGENCSDEAINRALNVASAVDIIDSLPQGLATHVPAGATTLSGGQRQRLRLARALLRDPEVLVLAQPTSALDALTEDAIARRIGHARAGSTTVIISNSPLVLAHCDESVLLGLDGVVCRGKHEELMHEPSYRSVVLRVGQGTA